MALEPWPLTVKSRGERTKTAQWLMQGHNVLGIHTYKGPIDGISGPETVKAFRDTRSLLGFPQEYILGEYGPVMQEYLLGQRKLPVAYRARRAKRLHDLRKTLYYPLSIPGQVIGTPGVGTHSWWTPPNNWQSDNAVDLGTPYGTLVLAYTDGDIGSRIGPLSDSASRFHGIRLYLETKDNQFYYAHLSLAFVKAGQRVKAGQILGRSGVANGVNHLHWASEHGSPVDLLKGL